MGRRHSRLIGSWAHLQRRPNRPISPTSSRKKAQTSNLPGEQLKPLDGIRSPLLHHCPLPPLSDLLLGQPRVNSQKFFLLGAYVRHTVWIGVNGVSAESFWPRSWLLLIFLDAPLLLPSSPFSSKPSWCCFPPETPPELSLLHLPEVFCCCHLQLFRFPVLLYSTTLWTSFHGVFSREYHRTCFLLLNFYSVEHLKFIYYVKTMCIYTDEGKKMCTFCPTGPQIRYGKEFYPPYLCIKG